VIRTRFLLATTHTRRRIENIDGVLKGDETEEKANGKKRSRDAMPTTWRCIAPIGDAHIPLGVTPPLEFAEPLDLGLGVILWQCRFDA
jgi:hypothetical protein